ncbi:MAG: (Fe-S)-binding protein [Anaerolineales bacterium]|nr:(Fe-S)-binding protein [Anaerolineales bacterium]
MTASILDETMIKNRVWHCLECGKCSAVCPITRAHGGSAEGASYTSPRLLVELAMQREAKDVFETRLFWSCLTCQRCSEICPSGINFSAFIRDARSLARGEGRSGACTHGEVIQSWARTMTEPELKQQRLGWLQEGLQIAEQSDTLFFTGCLPYYDVLFSKLGFEGLEIARAAVKILNHLGITPIVLPDERCCGHDQLWQGDLITFRRLAERNLEMIKASGVRRVVATCPECVRTLKIDYPQHLGDHGLEVLHITELIAQSDLSFGKNGPDSTPTQVTYQDPCRLGRHLGVYDAPRALIAGLGFELKEMQHNRQASLCCGTSCWTNCGQVSKDIQLERLQEAAATGAELLVTTCLKCQIHFRCAQKSLEIKDPGNIAIRDLTTLVAEYLT